MSAGPLEGIGVSGEAGIMVGVGPAGVGTEVGVGVGETEQPSKAKPDKNNELTKATMIFI